MYELARQYFVRHGDLLISGDIITPCGKHLYHWTGTQRQAYKRQS